MMWHIEEAAGSGSWDDWELWKIQRGEEQWNH